MCWRLVLAEPWGVLGRAEGRVDWDWQLLWDAELRQGEICQYSQIIVPRLDKNNLDGVFLLSPN